MLHSCKGVGRFEHDRNGSGHQSPGTPVLSRVACDSDGTWYEPAADTRRCEFGRPARENRGSRNGAGLSTFPPKIVRHFKMLVNDFSICYTISMLKYQLLHPEILQALGAAGHGAKILIADGNYPLVTRSNPDARHVYLNLAPGLVTVIDVLKVLVEAVPLEAAEVMGPDSGEEPSIFADFRGLLPAGLGLRRLGRFEFYDAARASDTALAIATGEQRIYANILLTIGVIPPPGGKL